MANIEHVQVVKKPAADVYFSCASGGGVIG